MTTPLLILLTGPMRAGKDSVADILLTLVRPGTGAFKVPLALGVKEELAGILHVPVEEQERNRAKWRRVWQFWATEARRAISGEDYWLRVWGARMKGILPARPGVVIVPDVRFENEPAALRAWARDRGWRVVTIRVTRGWRNFRPWRKEWWHRSEREWRRVPADTHIWNTGTKDDLTEQVREAWRFIHSPWFQVLHPEPFPAGMGEVARTMAQD